MKRIIVLVVLFAFAAGSVCFAAEGAKTTKAKDPVTATCEVAGKTVAAPVEAVFGGKKKTEEPAKTGTEKTTKKK